MLIGVIASQDFPRSLSEVQETIASLDFDNGTYTVYGESLVNAMALGDAKTEWHYQKGVPHVTEAAHAHQ